MSTLNVNDIKDKKKSSIIFSWKSNDFYNLLKSCDDDDDVKITLKYLNNKDTYILEAGCGLGRVVKYLYDLGFKNVRGIELDKDSVDFLNCNFPELNVIHGNILCLPYKKKSFDIVLSYGVIEHFLHGPDKPMKSMYEILKPGGLAIITVPSFNILRMGAYFFSFLDVRKYGFIRRLFNKKPLHCNGKRFSYYIDPQYGKFFEYRFTKKQFEDICIRNGFEIIESVPTSNIDGLFHLFGSNLVTFKDWKFNVSKLGSLINKFLSIVPFLHNHMHACVVRKPNNND